MTATVWKMDLEAQGRKSCEEAATGIHEEMMLPKLRLEQALEKPLQAHKSFQGPAL